MSEFEEQLRRIIFDSVLGLLNGHPGLDRPNHDVAHDIVRDILDRLAAVKLEVRRVTDAA